MPAGVAYDGSVWVTAAGSVGLGKSRPSPKILLIDYLTLR